MTTLGYVLAVACLAIGVLHLLRVRLDLPGEATHAAMGLGMAAMFSPLGDPVPVPVWSAVFLLGGAWFAAAALRSPAGRGRDDAVHHVVASGAMLFMLLGAHGGGVAGTGAVHAGHVGHGGGPEGGPGAASLVAIVLAAWFAWHALRRGNHLPPAPVPTPGAVAVRTSVLRDARTVALAHVVMAGAMTVMLLGMV